MGIQIKRGIPILTINIEKDNIFFPFKGGNMTRAHKLLNNLEIALIVTFINYEQLREIIKEYLSIYEDFKIAFFKHIELV